MTNIVPFLVNCSYFHCSQADTVIPVPVPVPVAGGSVAALSCAQAEASFSEEH